jgi:hypothetical protein
LSIHLKSILYFKLFDNNFKKTIIFNLKTKTVF